MKSSILWAGALAVAAFVSTSAHAADAVTGGTVKGVDAKAKSFTLTDSAGKDWKFKIADNAIINRGGKESTADLAVGDAVNVCYDKGLATMAAHYILVQEGETKNQNLVHGILKSYDSDKREIVLTDENKKDWTFSVATAKVMLDKREASIRDAKIGDHVGAIVGTVDGTPTVHKMMLKRS